MSKNTPSHTDTAVVVKRSSRRRLAKGFLYNSNKNCDISAVVLEWFEICHRNIIHVVLAGVLPINTPADSKHTSR